MAEPRLFSPVFIGDSVWHESPRALSVGQAAYAGRTAAVFPGGASVSGPLGMSLASLGVAALEVLR